MRNRATSTEKLRSETVPSELVGAAT